MKVTQSSISFQNISLTRSPVKQKICVSHPMKQAKYYEEMNNQYFCEPCAIQLASQGFAMSAIQNNSLTDKQQNKLYQMETEFNINQQKIRSEIQKYNEIFTDIVDTLTDMQIKDLMEYNRLLKENEKKFKQKKGNFKQTDHEVVKKVANIVQLLSEIMKKLSSSSVSDTLVSKKSSLSQNSSVKCQFNPAKNLKTLSSQSTIISKRKKAKTKPIQKSIQQQIKDKHQISFNQSLQDTPESVKAVNGRIKAMNQPVGMFDRIDICQSLQDLHLAQNLSCGNENINSINSLQKKDSKVFKQNKFKSENRYQDYSEFD